MPEKDKGEGPGLGREPLGQSIGEIRSKDCPQRKAFGQKCQALVHTHAKSLPKAPQGKQSHELQLEAGTF